MFPGPRRQKSSSSGGKEGSHGTPKTLPQKMRGEGLCSLLGQRAQASTHSPLWIELLSNAAGIVGVSRTQETSPYVLIYLFSKNFHLLLTFSFPPTPPTPTTPPFPVLRAVRVPCPMGSPRSSPLHSGLEKFFLTNFPVTLLPKLCRTWKPCLQST